MVPLSSYNLLAAPPLNTRPCIWRFALGPGFVSQSDDVSLLVLCRGCAISADNLCLPLHDDPASRLQGRVLGA